MKAKTKLTKLWSILLVLVMVVGMLPTVALAAGAAMEKADFSADPTTALDLLNNAKTGTEESTWDSDTKTLTLNGVNFTTTAATAVKLPDGSTIVLNGVNTIKGVGSSSEDSYGIYADGALTIQGTGTLNVTGGDTSSRSCGIYANNGNVIISGGTITATGGTSGRASLGIYSKGNLTISGTADVTGKGGTATGDGSFGINAEGEVKISGGKVKAIGGAGKGSDGLYSGNGQINISGGKVEAFGGDAPSAGGSFGIFAQTSGANVTITGTADVTARGGESASDRSYGIYSRNPVTISGGKVEAFGGEGCYPGYGINKANISGGTVTAASEYGDAINNVTTGSGFKTISFDRNGGSGEMIAYTNADSYILPANGFTAPADKEFKGWAKSANGEVISGTTIDVSADTKLFAIWEDIKYTVTFDVNGANAAVAPASGATNAAGKLTSLPTPIRSGYTFKGWNTKQDGTGTTVTSETTFTENTTVYAQWEVATIAIPSVAITGVDAPKSNTAFDTAAVCESAGVSNAKPTVTWDSSDSKAGYGKIYTASITLTASEGYKFANSVTATVNGNPATSVTKNANGTLTVTYTFPATDKHNIEITVDTDVRDGDAAKNPTISSGYEIEYCLFVEDTDKDGVFINKTGDSITFDDKTLVVDKALVEAFAAQSGGKFTYESLMDVLKDEFDLDELKTEFTGGYDYSVLAYICHSDNAYFDNDDNQIVTNAIVKVNGKKITDNCLGYGGGMEIMPVAYVFSAAKTYTVSFDADGGTGSMAAATGISGEYTLPANGFTAPEGKRFKVWSVNGTEKAVGDKITVTADTTVKAVWEAVKYNVTVTNGTASPSQAAAGTTVTLTANAASTGEVFDKWVVESGGITLADENSATTTFTMPAGNVTAEATYKNIPVVTYTVTFEANGGSGSMAAVTGVSGDYILPVCGFTAPAGQQFKAWSVNGTEKAVGDKITVSADTTVKAVWENIPAAPIEYEILDGANSRWTQDSDGNLSVRGNGAFSEFVGVKVDGKSVDEKYYTVKEGSTIVTLKAGYLNTLTVGSHTLEIIWTDGSASTAFTVSAQTVVESPQTGDNNRIALWIALLFVSAAGVLGTAVLGKKKQNQAE